MLIKWCCINKVCCKLRVLYIYVSDIEYWLIFFYTLYESSVSFWLQEAALSFLFQYDGMYASEINCLIVFARLEEFHGDRQHFLFMLEQQPRRNSKSYMCWLISFSVVQRSAGKSCGGADGSDKRYCNGANTEVFKWWLGNYELSSWYICEHFMEFPWV